MDVFEVTPYTSERVNRAKRPVLIPANYLDHPYLVFVFLIKYICIVIDYLPSKTKLNFLRAKEKNLWSKDT